MSPEQLLDQQLDRLDLLALLLLLAAIVAAFATCFFIVIKEGTKCQD